MWSLQSLVNLLSYVLFARTPGQMHSPFLYDLLTTLHRRKIPKGQFSHIEALRSALLRDHSRISIVDFGAGSRLRRGKSSTSVSSIAKTSLSSPARCEMMAGLIAHQTPQTILELGTSLGIMTAYLATAAQHNATIHTIEGDPGIADLARRNVSSLDLHRVHFHAGNFDAVLPGLLEQLGNVDLVLIDGNHRGEALKKYVEMLMPHLSQHAIVVVDDIRWSAGMLEAWHTLQLDPAVRCSLDYFTFGILFFSTDFGDKMDYRIIPRRLPPQILA